LGERIYTIEQEQRILEKKIRDLGIFLNDNYIRAEKGPRPLFYNYFSLAPTNAFMKRYFIAFSDDELVLIHLNYLEEEDDKYITRIKHDDIKHFTVRNAKNYCIQFEYRDKRFYFYVPTGGNFANLETNYSEKNFFSLWERGFKGLL